MQDSPALHIKHVQSQHMHGQRQYPEIWLISYLGKMEKAHTFLYFYRDIKQLPGFLGVCFTFHYERGGGSLRLSTNRVKGDTDEQQCAPCMGLRLEGHREISLGNRRMHTAAGRISHAAGQLNQTQPLIGLLTWELQSNN